MTHRTTDATRRPIAFATFFLACCLAVPALATEPVEVPTRYATSPEKCASFDAGTEGVGWDGARLLGFEWECTVVGPAYGLSVGTAYILACQEEGVPVQRVAVATVAADSTLTLDVSDYTAFELTLCEP